jgi:hypothetical protein
MILSTAEHDNNGGTPIRLIGSIGPIGKPHSFVRPGAIRAGREKKTQRPEGPQDPPTRATCGGKRNSHVLIAPVFSFQARSAAMSSASL